MEAMILDKSFNNVFMIDTFQSFIWTDKYQSVGDFELYTFPTSRIVEHAIKDYYIWFRDSEHVMVIDTIEVKNDLDQGTMIIVSGESAECFLKRRWITSQKVGNVEGKDIQDFVSSVFNHCFRGGDRAVKHFFFERNPSLEANQFPSGKALKVTGEYYEKNFYDVVEEICVANDLGFKVTMEKRTIDGMERDAFILRLYSGVDRSYDQENRPSVTFSPNFSNLLSSSYYSSYKQYVNTVILHYKENVDYWDEDQEKWLTKEVEREKAVWLGDSKTAPSGLERRETYLNVTPDEDVKNVTKWAIEEGKTKLKETATTEAFDGEVDPYGQYRYARDFAVGDVVQIIDAQGYYAKSRITAVTFSSDESGEKIYPTFEKVSDAWSDQDET